MNVRAWPHSRIQSLTVAAIYLVTLGSSLGVQLSCAEEGATRFSLLPPAPVEVPQGNPAPGAAALVELIPEASADTVAAELPPAFTPPADIEVLPPAFTPPKAIELAAPSQTFSPMGGVVADAEQSAIVSAADFGPPPLATTPSTVVLGPELPPKFAGPRLAQRTTADPQPGTPPLDVFQSETSIAATIGGAAKTAKDRQFYEQILHDPTAHPESGEVDQVIPDARAPVAPPAEPSTWWETYAAQPMRDAAEARPVSINSLIASALQYSAQVRVISDTPLIRDTAITESDAAFDWSGFVETNWYDTNEPVGSTLTTGGPPRFENELFEYEAGVRKQTTHGGRFEVGQRYGHERSNSIFFIPNDQGTSRLTLSYTQPLLRGGGRIYNTSLVLLAQVEAGAARNEFSRELQEHLLEVTRGYWALYLERGALIQKERLYERGQVILIDLEHRQVIDAVMNQIVRARAAVAARKSDLYRTAAAVKNAEGRIRALVNSPDLGMLDEYELIPTQGPTPWEVPVDMRASLETSFRERPEIHSAIKQIKASAVRQKMSKNELLPALDVVLETYVAGLRGESNVGKAWHEMFTEGAPSYSAGLQLEVPLRNREARSRFQRRSLELRQFQNQFRATLHAMQLEVEISVREVQASYREMVAKRAAMEAARSEVDYIDRRWRLLPGEDRTASLVLEDLLGAQERLTAEEFGFLTAQVSYNLALTSLKKATGTLLQVENVSVAHRDDGGIPALQLHKGNVGPVSYDLPIR